MPNPPSIDQSSQFSQPSIAPPPKAPPLLAKGFTISPQKMQISPQGFRLIEGTLVLPSTFNQSLFSTPPAQAITFNFPLPPEVKEQQPVEFSALQTQALGDQELHFAINNQAIPRERILIKSTELEASEKSIRFTTNAFPVSTPLIFTLTSPSGLITFAQYIAPNELTSRLELTSESTLLALLRAQTPNQELSQRELVTKIQEQQLIATFEQLLAAENLSQNILESDILLKALTELPPAPQTNPTPTVLDQVESVEISPPNLILNKVGDTQILQAIASDSKDQTLTTLTYTWSSDNPEIATVNEQGIVTAQGVGLTSIKAKTQGVEGVAVVRVDNDAITEPTITSLTPLIGKVGEIITIRGNGFAVLPSQNTVRFGTKNLTLPANSSREIIFEVPKDLALGLQEVYVENSQGRSNSINFTLVP